MLACHRRQLPHHRYTPSDLPSPTSSHSSYFDNLPFPIASPSPSDYSKRATAHCLDLLLASNSAAVEPPNCISDQYMSDGFDYANPAIRIQQSTPTPQHPFSYSHQPALVDGSAHDSNWCAYADPPGQMVVSSFPAPPSSHPSRSHQRHQSSSSVGSDYSTTLHNRSHATGYPYGQAQAAAPVPDFESYHANEASGVYSNHLPTPSQTPTQDSFVANYPNFASQNQSIDSTLSAHMAMKQALMDQQSAHDEDMPGFSHSGKHSVSSFGDHSPSTPQTMHGEETEDAFKVLSSHDLVRNVPRLERTVSNIYQDELYNPTIPTPINTSVSSKSNKASLLSPYRNVVNERLQAANDARSQSPTSAGSRGVSPFRQGSPLAPVHDSFGSSRPRIGTAAQVRQHNKTLADAAALRQHISHQPQPEPKTISPKDALLDYHENEEDAKMPLFSDTDANDYQQRYSSGGQNIGDTTPVKFDSSPDQSYSAPNVASNGAVAWTHNRRQSSSSYSAGTTAPPQSSFNFVTPGAPSSMQQMPFAVSQNYRIVNSMPVTSVADETPEFPAHLTSMESSASEAAPPSSNNSNGQYSSNNNDNLSPKPASSTADTGTYTCTYHGCSLRFETPQKLQKHKREGHRQNATQPQPQRQSPPASVVSGMTSAALLERNSQAGPHKCDRINPTTGKPCNTVFSRPYDLTRHEDTIHNVRKQKVKCALCIEDKTFSRNDALTRHLRVVHPEVDFPGKHRRRGGHD